VNGEDIVEEERPGGGAEEGGEEAVEPEEGGEGAVAEPALDAVEDRKDRFRVGRITFGFG
jgi:hypothetical protein